MSFINFNNREDHSAEYSVEMVREALLAIESKNINKVDSLLEGFSDNINMNDALNLFSNKLDAISALDAAKVNNIEQVVEARSNLIKIKVKGKQIKVDIDTVEIDGIDTRDYPDFVDAFFSYAEDHKGKKLSDDELDVLTDEHSDLINELIFDQQLYAGLIIAEGKSINKIQKEWAEVTADMASTVKVWKTAEGETKTQLLDKLRALNLRKKELEQELDTAVMGKDRNVELSGAFESAVNEYQGDGTNKISDDRLGRLIPKMPKGYHGDNTGIGEYTISTPSGENIVLTRSRDKKNWFYEPSNVALKILEATDVKEPEVTEGLDENKPYFDFLVALRDSGATNMFGAAPYLQDAFDLSKSEAKKILIEWMKSFNEALVNEKFFRMSKDTIENELYAASQALTTYYDWLKAGNDSGRGKSLDHIIDLLKKCKGDIKKFNKSEEVEGTAYEAQMVEGNAFLGARAKAIEEDKEEFEFNGKTYKVTSKVNEGAVKRFEYDFNQMVKDIKKGYGWIAPDHVAFSWENSSDSIDFELVKGELYRRLIDLNILAHGDENDPEAPGEYIKSLKSLNVKELVAERKLTWESLKESLGL